MKINYPGLKLLIASAAIASHSYLYEGHVYETELDLVFYWFMFQFSERNITTLATATKNQGAVEKELALVLVSSPSRLL